MKIIFLDIDGVLNCMTTKQKWEDVMGLDPSKVKIFNSIVRKTGAKVVLSSTWRLDDNWRATMKMQGIEADFIDRTPYLRGAQRWDEIRAWLADHPETGEYAVIDDDFGMLPGKHIFKTSLEKGLTEEIAEAVVDHFR